MELSISERILSLSLLFLSTTTTFASSSTFTLALTFLRCLFALTKMVSQLQEHLLHNNVLLLILVLKTAESLTKSLELGVEGLHILREKGKLLVEVLLDSMHS